MPDYVQILLLALLAGAAIPLGGALGAIESLYPRWLNEDWRHGIIAFGGGALLSAISLVLIPEGIKSLSTLTALGSFLAGGILFCVLDYRLSKSKGSAAQLMAMLLDFIPEAIALGAALAQGSGTGILLAFLIAVQNLPEGFNSFREIKSSSSYKSIKIIGFFVLLSFLGPLSAYLGATALAGEAAILGVLMLASSGGILYLTFQDIAPQAKLEKHWAPSVGAVLGFAVGLAGHMFTHS